MKGKTFWSYWSILKELFAIDRTNMRAWGMCLITCRSKLMSFMSLRMFRVDSRKLLTISRSLMRLRLNITKMKSKCSKNKSKIRSNSWIKPGWFQRSSGKRIQPCWPSWTSSNGKAFSWRKERSNLSCTLTSANRDWRWRTFNWKTPRTTPLRTSPKWPPSKTTSMGSTWSKSHSMGPELLATPSRSWTT